MNAKLTALSSQLTGSVVLPEAINGKGGMPTYWMPFRTHALQVPVVFAKTTRDVQLAVEFAREDGRKVFVSTTGHGTAAIQAPHSLLLVPRFDAPVMVNPSTQTAEFPGGTTWGKANAATVPHGLVGLHDSSTNVAAMGGYTFYGGVGPVTRRHGLAVDSILGLDVVTSNGELIRADRENNPDLYWAMAGGGASNFGVAVGMDIKLHKVCPVRMIGMMYMLGNDPEAEVTEFLDRFRTWCEHAPRERMSVIALKPRSGVDEATYYIKPHLYIEFYWCGDTGQAMNEAEYWTNWRQPRSLWWADLNDDFEEIGISPFKTPATMAGGHSFPKLCDKVIQIAANYGTGEFLTNVIIRHIQGAKDDYEGDNSLPIRDDQFLMSFYTDVLDEEGASAYSQFVHSADQELGCARSLYLNYTRPDEVPTYYQSAFRQTYNRLKQIKQDYDPSGLFCGGGMSLQ